MAKSGGTVLATSTTVTGFVQNFKLKSAAYARRQSSNKNNKLYASSMDVSESIEMMPVYQGMSSRYRISQPPKLDTLYVSNKNVPNTIPLEITAHHPLASKSASANRSASFGVRRCFRLAGDDSASVVVVVVASSVAFDCRCARVAVIARLARVPPRQTPSSARARARESRIAARGAVVAVVVIVVVVAERVVAARARRGAPYDVDARGAHLAHLAPVAVAPVVIASTVVAPFRRRLEVTSVVGSVDRGGAKITRARCRRRKHEARSRLRTTATPPRAGVARRLRTTRTERDGGGGDATAGPKTTGSRTRPPATERPLGARGERVERRSR